jgi:hypothetical protein
MSIVAVKTGCKQSEKVGIMVMIGCRCVLCNRSRRIWSIILFALYWHTLGKKEFACKKACIVGFIPDSMLDSCNY